MTHWNLNEYGFWCPSCGDRIGRASAEEDTLPEECRSCGFPDIGKVAEYHCPDDDDEGSPELEFDCGMMPDGTCQLAGTEECDWDCPYS